MDFFGREMRILPSVVRGSGRTVAWPTSGRNSREGLNLEHQPIPTEMTKRSGKMAVLKSKAAPGLRRAVGTAH